MKKSIITGMLFLVAVSFSAQEKGTKNTKPIKDTKVVVNPIKPTVFNKETKPTPIVKVTPVAEVKFQTSKTRTTSTNVNTSRPEKVTNNKAASSNVNTSKEEKTVNNRAASQSVINTMNAEKEVIVEESTKTKKEKPSRKERKSKK